MLHDLPRQLSRHRHGRTVFKAVVAGFLLVQIGLIVRHALPKPFGAPLPWRMFHRVSPKNQSVRIAGLTESGGVLPIDAQRWFRFRSGASQFPAFTRHPALWGSSPWKDRNQRVFGRWLAQKVWLEDGTRLQEVWISRTRVHIRTGRSRESKRINIPIEPIDLEREVPREAWVGPQ